MKYCPVCQDEVSASHDIDACREQEFCYRKTNMREDESEDKRLFEKE